MVEVFVMGVSKKLRLVWEYEGGPPFEDILDWCRQNIEAWRYGHQSIYFYTEKDFTMFLLRWGE